MAERISQPSRTPTPRKERTEVRFALSYEALKTKSISSAAQISVIFFAIRQTNFSDSITHGPRMNTGFLPPMTTLPTVTGLAFINRSFSRCGRLRSIALPPLALCGNAIASHHIVNGKWRIQPEKERQGQSVHLQKVKRVRIGKKTQNRKCFRFMQQKSVIKTCQFVGNERNHKIKLRPEKHAHDRHGIWPVSARQHQEDDADDDPAMRGEKADESPIWKAKTQVWREHSLQRAANSPEICNLEPALISGAHCYNDNHHAPIAQLHRQHLLPARGAAAADKNQIDDVVQHKDCRENADDRFFGTGRFCAPHNRGQREWEDNREENNGEMRQTVRLEFRLH